MSDQALDNTYSNTSAGIEAAPLIANHDASNSFESSESAQEAARIMGLADSEPSVAGISGSPAPAAPAGTNGSTTNVNATSTPPNFNAAPIVDQAKQQAQKVIEHTQRTAGDAIGQARTKTTSWIETQLDVAADNLKDIAGAVRDTGAQMRTTDPTHLGQIADFANGAAGAVEGVSTRLRDATVDDIVVETSQLARQQPAVFIGAAFALGFLLARFLKSTSPAGSAGYSSNSFSGSTDRLLPIPLDQEPQAGV